MMSIILHSKNLEPVQFELATTSPQFAKQNAPLDKSICSDRAYSATLIAENLDEFKTVQLYVNNINVNCKTYKHDDCVDIVFCDSEYNGSLIFRDCFGFVYLMLVVTFESSEVVYYTPLANVLVRDNQESRSVRKMAEYIYHHHNEYLFGNKTQPLDSASQQKRGQTSLETQLQTLKTIANVYEKNQAYFRINSRFKLEQKESIQSIEKMRGINAHSLHYIAQNPQNLVEVQRNTGLRYSHKYYLPQKVLSAENLRTFDIYENQTLVGFLKTLLQSIEKLLKSIEARINSYKEKKQDVAGYVESADFIYGNVRQVLFAHYDELKTLQKSIGNLYSAYSAFLAVEEKVLSRPPSPTAIFLEVPQYRQVFNEMIKWFEFGIYDFTKEDFIYPFLVNNVLYEYYALLRLLSGIKKCGYTLQDSQPFPYHFKGTVKYQNSRYENTFVFNNEKEKITLYYQPVIYGYDYAGRNGLELFRNTSISYPKKLELDNLGENNYWKNCYYSPDYIIKIEKTNETIYLILDAKFSTIDTIKKYQISALTFKYLISISPMNNNAAIAGIYALCGKSSDSIGISSIYDTLKPPVVADPRANIKIVTLLETEEDTEQDYQHLISTLLKPYLQN